MNNHVLNNAQDTCMLCNLRDNMTIQMSAENNKQLSNSSIMGHVNLENMTNRSASKRSIAVIFHMPE